VFKRVGKVMIVLDIVLVGKGQSQLGVHYLGINADLYTCEPINGEFVGQIVTYDAIVVDLVGAILHAMVGMKFKSIGKISNLFFFV
jgi:hypothetical protein